MYCMNIVVIGCDARILNDVRREALNHLATIEAEFDDLPSALHGVDPTANESRMFIVQVGSVAELSQLKRISGTFVGRPILALVDADKDASMVVKAMRAGAIQVVLLPFQRADFGAALDCIAVQFGLAPARAQTIAVAGASGGCGATTVAINLANEIAVAKKLKCILMELSLRMGVLANYLDIQPRFTTSDLLFDKSVDTEAVKQSLTAINDELSILSGPYQTVEPGAIVPDDVLTLIELVSRLSEVVVLDVPCTFDDLYFKAIAAADKFVLVTQQKVSSMRSVQMVCETLPELPVIVVINRYDAKMQGFTTNKLRALLKCPGLLTIANDPLVRVAGDQGQLLRQAAPKSAALTDIRVLMETLIPKELDPDHAANKSSLLGRLSGQLKNVFSTSTKA
jgi:pilus assembly protein CpaE